MTSKLLWITGFCVVFSLTAVAAASDENAEAEESFFSKLPIETHGFYEVRGGYRLQEDKYEKDMSIMEGRSSTRSEADIGCRRTSTKKTCRLWKAASSLICFRTSTGAM